MICIKNPHYSSKEIAMEFNQGKEEKNKISPSSVRRILLKFGLRSFCARKKPILIRKMIIARNRFCNQYKNKTKEFWRKFFFR